MENGKPETENWKPTRLPTNFPFTVSGLSASLDFLFSCSRCGKLVLRTGALDQPFPMHGGCDLVRLLHLLDDHLLDLFSDERDSQHALALKIPNARSGRRGRDRVV